MKRKILLFILVITMLLAAAGCQKTPQSSETDTQTPAKSDSPDSTDEGVAVDTTKLPDAEFTCFIPDQNAKIPPDDAPVMQQIYDLTGVRIKRIIPPAEPLERLNVMLATDDLPDLIQFYDPTIMKQFIDAGKIIPLNDLMEENCPDILNVNWATFINRLYDDEGNLYFMPGGYLLGGSEYAMPETDAGLSVRTGYFEEAGYDKIPKTWEQYKALLPQIKEKYPQMAPVSLALGAQGQLDAIIDIAGGAYGLEMSDRLVRSNGKLIYFTQSPEIKDFFAFLNSLNLEGYLDIESPVLSTEALKQKCVAAKVWSHIGHGWEIGSEVIAYESGNGSNEQMIYSIFPKANDSIEKVTYARSALDMYNSGLTITTKCADPARFLQFYDYCNTEEGHFNVLGTVNWEFTGENTVEATENYNFIIRQDELVDGKPRVEFSAWTGEMWAQDENWWWNWGIKMVQTISYLPHFVSYVVVANIALTLLSPTGVVMEILMKLGIVKESFVIFAQPKAFWWLVAGLNTWKEMGWSAIIYIAAIAGIDPQIYEAAMVDGAGRMRRIWHITLTGIRPTIVVLLILAVPDLLNAGFEPSYLLGNAMVSNYSEVLDTYVYKLGIAQGQFSMATAVGLFRMFIGLILIVSANAFARRVSEYSLY